MVTVAVPKERAPGERRVALVPEVVARLSATPGHVRWAGRSLDADGDDIRAGLDDQH